MESFFKWIDDLVSRFPLHVEIVYNKTCDWSVYVYKKGCASDYPDSKHNGDDCILCNTQSGDIDLAFAQAQCEIKEWLSTNCGGY